MILLIALLALAASIAAAEPLNKPKSVHSNPQLPPSKRTVNGSSCAVYGRGFVKVEGTDTCMKIGGAVSLGAGVSTGGGR